MAIRAGIVGIGSWYSQAFANALRRIPDVELAAAAHLGQEERTLVANTGYTREQYAERFGVRLFESAEQLLDSARLDMALVCVPDNQKADHAIRCIEAGLDTYIAKPMTNSPADAHRILAAAQKSDRLVGTLEPAHYDGAIREAHRRVVEGEIGDVLMARAWIQHGCWPAGRSREGSVEFGDGQGGTMHTLGVYAAGLLNWFIGAPAERAYAEAMNLNSPGLPFPDCAKGVVRYANRRLGSMDIYYCADYGPAPLWEIEVGGTKGLLRTQQSSFEGFVWKGGAVQTFYRGQNDVIQGAMESWVASCRERKPPDFDAEAATAVIEICRAWEMSAARGESVALPLGAGKMSF
jgi:predicted dehydrogenase